MTRAAKRNLFTVDTGHHLAEAVKSGVKGLKVLNMMHFHSFGVATVGPYLSESAYADIFHDFDARGSGKNSVPLKLSGRLVSSGQRKSSFTFVPSFLVILRVTSGLSFCSE